MIGSVRRMFRATTHVALFSGAVVGMASNAIQAQDTAAVVKSGDNTALVKPEGSKEWSLTKMGEKIPEGAQVLAGRRSLIVAPDGDISLEFRGDLAGISPFPIHETVVQLKKPGEGIDLEITPQRGRVDLVNTKKEGSAVVKVHLFGETALIKLKTPETRFTLEMYGRWAAGESFSRNYTKDQTPTISVVLVVTKGEIEISHEEVTTRLSAPPGPAKIQFNNHTVGYIKPEFLDKLPEWASDTLKTDNPLIAARFASAAKFFDLLKEKGDIPAALKDLAASDNETDRRLAIFAMGATDNLDSLWSTMLTLKTREVIDDAVIALRHWIGREPGQDAKLWDYLVNKRKYTETQADQTLDLLHSPSKSDLARPEYYEHLILLLNAKRDMPRVLAYWHLVRLVPQGAALNFNPLGKPEERKEAAAKWANLIPKGKLPPESVSNEKETDSKPAADVKKK